MFTDVIKSLCSEAIVRTDGYPLAESFVITDNGNLGTYTEDHTFQATDIIEVNWKEEQKKDPTISRIYHIIDNIYFRRTNCERNPRTYISTSDIGALLPSTKLFYTDSYRVTVGMCYS
ncbi:hypothetical protein DPMN_166025 [Dreissena polymorpha]|uniref:Uncharacterized protein n=1 Tax=Dreissena polymorpha TaxID=45954 RepID=A0A9D4IX03_DREPO|nr:hypothetical protein DPMN_166025 [Dreissena polymorpha]